MNHWPRICRIAVPLAAAGLVALVRTVSRRLDHRFDSRAKLTDVELIIAARLYRLHPQPHKLAAGVGASPTPAPAVSHQHLDAEVFHGADQ